MNKKATGIFHKKWGMHHGKQVYLFTITDPAGSFVQLTNYGATIVSIVVPGRQGRFDNVVLGFSTLEGYLNDNCYIGSTIGRYANRICGSRFTQDGITYRLEPNDHGNSNHGGINGFNTRVFDFEIADDTISFSLLSKDGEGGYPGNLWLTVIYSWSLQHGLSITYKASTDKKTVANFTNHTYFNLSGGTSNILDHELTVYAGELIETDGNQIPTGRITGTNDRDFSQTRISEKVVWGGDTARGINDCYVLNKETAACRLTDHAAGRSLEVSTSYPGLLVYTGDFLNSGLPGHNGKMYTSFDGICLECQYYPDSPNHFNFPDTTLNKDQPYFENIRFKFGISRAEEYTNSF